MRNPERAKALLKDEFFDDVVKKQRQMYIDSIVNSNPEDGDVRESAYIKLRALDEFVATLESMAKEPEIEKKRWKVF